jgi:hypothetical protein
LRMFGRDVRKDASDEVRQACRVMIDM